MTNEAMERLVNGWRKAYERWLADTCPNPQLIPPPSHIFEHVWKAALSAVAQAAPEPNGAVDIATHRAALDGWDTTEEELTEARDAIRLAYKIFKGGGVVTGYGEMKEWIILPAVQAALEPR